MVCVHCGYAWHDFVWEPILKWVTRMCVLPCMRACDFWDAWTDFLQTWYSINVGLDVRNSLCQKLWTVGPDQYKSSRSGKHKYRCTFEVCLWFFSPICKKPHLYNKIRIKIMLVSPNCTRNSNRLRQNTTENQPKKCCNLSSNSCNSVDNFIL